MQLKHSYDPNNPNIASLLLSIYLLFLHFDGFCLKIAAKLIENQERRGAATENRFIVVG